MPPPSWPGKPGRPGYLYKSTPKKKIPFIRSLPDSRTASHILSSMSLSVASATGASRQSFDDRVDQPHSHGCDRVRNVAFRPQGGILWVDNLRVEQASGMARRDEVLRGN